MTDAGEGDFCKAKTVVRFQDGTEIKTWLGASTKDIFIANAYGNCKYARFVGLVHIPDLDKAIDRQYRLRYAQVIYKCQKLTETQKVEAPKKDFKGGSRKKKK